MNKQGAYEIAEYRAASILFYENIFSMLLKQIKFVNNIQDYH